MAPADADDEENAGEDSALLSNGGGGGSNDTEDYDWAGELGNSGGDFNATDAVKKLQQVKDEEKDIPVNKVMPPGGGGLARLRTPARASTPIARPAADLPSPRSLKASSKSSETTPKRRMISGPSIPIPAKYVATSTGWDATLKGPTMRGRIAGSSELGNRGPSLSAQQG